MRDSSDDAAKDNGKVGRDCRLLCGQINPKRDVILSGTRTNGLLLGMNFVNVRFEQIHEFLMIDAFARRSSTKCEWLQNS